MIRASAIAFYFLWIFFWAVGVVITVLNIRWDVGGAAGIGYGAAYVFCAAMLNLTVAEHLVRTLFTIFCGACEKRERVGDGANMLLCINYNLLALSKDDIDETLDNMFEAYMGNLSNTVSAVLVSATNDAALKNYEIEIRDRYRVFIYNILQEELASFLVTKDHNKMDSNRYLHFWRKIELKHGLGFIQTKGDFICARAAREFMVIHRNSRVLRKCGQYQDLMLLADGHLNAFTYVDKSMYGPYARKNGSPMFQNTVDTRNILCRNYDYTLVLDSDCRIEPTSALQLLRVAAAHPNVPIHQPRIKLLVDRYDTIYMHLEYVRNRMHAATETAMARAFGRCQFYGKGLIKNRLYIDIMLGAPKKEQELVPVNALSHDVHESVILRTRYCSTVHIYEKPPMNYVAWNMRLRRWNQGDLILGMIYHSCLIGCWIKCFQKCCQGKKLFIPKLRFRQRFNCVTYYLASFPIRSIFEKPFWLLYILLHACLFRVNMNWPWVPIVVVMCIFVFCKFAVFMNCKFGCKCCYFLPEFISSIFQFSVEAFTGTVRLFRVLFYLCKGTKSWIPQRHIEDEFRDAGCCGVWLFSIKHLWIYPVIALCGAVILVPLTILGYANYLTFILLYVLLFLLLVLPIYCAVTAKQVSNCSACCQKGGGCCARTHEPKRPVYRPREFIPTKYRRDPSSTMEGPGGEQALLWHRRLHRYVPSQIPSNTRRKLTHENGPLEEEHEYDEIQTNVDYLVVDERDDEPRNRNGVVNKAFGDRADPNRKSAEYYYEDPDVIRTDSRPRSDSYYDDPDGLPSLPPPRSTNRPRSGSYYEDPDGIPNVPPPRYQNIADNKPKLDFPDMLDVDLSSR